MAQAHLAARIECTELVLHEGVAVGHGLQPPLLSQESIQRRPCKAQHTVKYPMPHWELFGTAAVAARGRRRAWVWVWAVA
jgi:hypothetical protein